MDETIVVDEGRVERDAIGIECDRGELEVQSIVVPLVVADLGGGEGQEPISHIIPRERTQGTAPPPGRQGTVPHRPCPINRSY